jgi:DUF4097 and DUF4098 domain-containing protein YvlB
MHAKLTIIAAALLLATSAVARETVDRSLDTNDSPEVSISNVAGSVKVVGGGGKTVRVEGSLDDDVEDLRIRAEEDRVDIEVILPRHSHRGGDADLVITVPKGAMVEVETVSAWIEVAGVEGELDLESVSGDITVEGADAEADVSSVSGRIELSGSFPRLEAESVSGDVEVDGASGDLEISTTSGRIGIIGGDFDSVDCQSVSGSIRFEGRPKKGAEISMENFSGNTTLRLPADLDATIEVETHSGDIESDFGDERVRREKYGPGAWFETEVGDGSARIEVSSFSGDVRLMKE